MKKNRTFILVSLLALLSAASCNDTTKVDFEDTYTVIWQDDNGDILELDRNVKEGSVPTYDSLNPTKDGYVFSGWTPEIKEVYENTSYTATYTKKLQTYTITWKNYDGAVLEVDTDVKYGTTPTYDGNVPMKPSTGVETYVFNGWSPAITTVNQDISYTATYYEINESDILGVNPIISNDGKTIQYGLYPQTHVKDADLIEKLNILVPTQINGWYLYENNYYVKETSNVYNNESYSFDDGTPITNNTEYWFKCEPISWNVLNDNDGTYYLLSEKLLDSQSFYSSYDNRTLNNQTIYANNYKESDIRIWLNQDFYNIAFSMNNTLVKETLIDNDSNTTDSIENMYACENTSDKVYLPSYQDYLNENYGFDAKENSVSKTRECKTTDYTRAKGSWCNNTDAALKYNGSYWTRSATSRYSYCAWNVNSGGFLSEYAVDGKSHSVRPCITIYIAK